jgi:hypothetical protein
LNTVKVRSLLFLFRPILANLILSNDTSNPKDGSGAQIHRILGIYALSRQIGSRYLHEPLIGVAVHPLDPFQTPDHYIEYLSELNSAFEIDSSGLKKNYKSVSINNPSVGVLIYFALVSIFKKERLLIKILEPFRVIDAIPSAYSKINGEFDLSKFAKKNSTGLTVVIHYRQGAGGAVVYPGQKISREIPFDYFLKLLCDLNIDLKSPEYSLTILTDSPKSRIYFAPPSNQLKFWGNTPRFENELIEVIPFDFKNALGELFECVNIVHGGSPLEAIAIMAEADYLLMGLSSLSYVGAILNKNGKIFMPAQFWHPPLAFWHVI